MNVSQFKEFFLAGNAVFTLKSLATGKHYTFRAATQDKDLLTKMSWVSLLVRPDEYAYLGTVFTNDDIFQYKQTKKSPPSSCHRIMYWFIQQINAGEFPDTVEVIHEGRCGRCGRTLTHPDSIESGLGPVCRSKL